MKRILPLLLALLSFFTIQQTFAQSNFVPGYIIKLNGDTVKGQLDDRNWNMNPTKITFKTDAEQQYTVNEITGFGTVDETYKRFTVSMILNKRNISDHIPNEAPRVVTDTSVFLRLLVKSDYDLYIFNDKSDLPHFYIVQNVNIHELTYKKQLIERGGSTYIGEDNSFRNQLIGALQPDKSLEKKINSARYEIADMIRIFQKNNESKGFENKQLVKEKLSFDFDIIAGASYASPSLSGTSAIAKPNYKFDGTIQPSFGLGFTAYLPRNRKQFSLDNQLIYSAYSSTSTGTYPTSTYEINSDVKLKASYIKLLNIFRYEYPKGKVRPFIGIGISNGLAIDIQTSYYRQNTLFEKNSATVPLFEETRNYEQSLVFLLGVNYNKFKFEIRNDQSNGISPYETTASKIKYYQFSIRYSLIRK